MSNEMIVVNYNNDRITTSARNLWEGLDRPYSEFMKWFDTYKAFGFEEGEDYKVIEQLLGNPNGGRPAQDYEITLDMAKQYDGHNWYLKKGYYYNNKLGLLHRYIWEVENKCKIPTGWVIHHINEDKTDNSIDNLEIMRTGNHTRHHNIRRSRIENYQEFMDFCYAIKKLEEKHI